MPRNPCARRVRLNICWQKSSGTMSRCRVSNNWGCDEKARHPGAQRLVRERRRVAKEFGGPVDDCRVERLAALNVAWDAFQAKIATGANFDLAELMKLDAMR